MPDISGIDRERFIFDGIEDQATTPVYNISEVGKFFFAKGPVWMRLREKAGALTLDGVPLVPKRTEKGHRYYTLPDVEKMAHALAQNGVLSGEQLVTVLTVIRDQSKLWGYI